MVDSLSVLYLFHCPLQGTQQKLSVSIKGWKSMLGDFKDFKNFKIWIYPHTWAFPFNGIILGSVVDVTGVVEENGVMWKFPNKFIFK